MRSRALATSLVLALISTFVLTLCPDRAVATSHLWRISEVYSDATGEVQFVEFKELMGDPHETHLNSSSVYLATFFKRYDFPNDLDGDTAFAWFLVGTPAYAALPDVPRPDYVLDEGLLPNFFDPNLDSITLRTNALGITNAIVTPGLMPMDGVNSLHFPLEGGSPTAGPASPTNLAGETGWGLVPIDDGSVGELKSRFDETERREPRAENDNEDE